MSSSERWSTPRPPVVERVDEGHLGVDELETVSLEAGCLEERRHRGQRVDGRAHVVLEPGQRQLGGAGAAADGVGRLEDEHGAAGLGARDGGGETVGPGSHDHDVRHRFSLGCS